MIFVMQSQPQRGHVRNNVISLAQMHATLCHMPSSTAGRNEMLPEVPDRQNDIQYRTSRKYTVTVYVFGLNRTNSAVVGSSHNANIKSLS